MLFRIAVATLILMVAGFTGSAWAACKNALITSAEENALAKTYREGMPEIGPIYGKAKISSKVTINWSYSETSKGNGTIKFPEIGINIYDAHLGDNGVIFKPYLLCVQLKDVNGDGYADLVMKGSAQYWKNMDGPGSPIPSKTLKKISASFLYNPQRQTFVAKSASKEIFYWTSKFYCLGMQCKDWKSQ